MRLRGRRRLRIAARYGAAGAVAAERSQPAAEVTDSQQREGLGCSCRGIGLVGDNEIPGAVERDPIRPQREEGLDVKKGHRTAFQIRPGWQPQALFGREL